MSIRTVVLWPYGQDNLIKGQTRPAGIKRPMAIRELSAGSNNLPK